MDKNFFLHNFEQTYTQTKLLMHAKHENHHRITQQKDPLKCGNDAGTIR